MVSRSIELQKAVAKPADFFRSPEQVVGDFRLDRNMKIAILQAWERDLEEVGDTGDEAAGVGQLAERVRRARMLLERSLRKRRS